MPRIELTLTTDYLPTWGPWEGLRELVQNARDAEVEFGAKMEVDWYNSKMRIANEGAVLPHEALLLGYSSKANRSDMIGKFGEGLKLGILALVRKGFGVKIRSGAEVWTPSIQRSEKFNADVLVFDIQTGRKDEQRVRVEVDGVPKEEYERISARFLFINKPKDNEKIHTDPGDLLLGEEYKGNIYVKGIYVEHKADMDFGYNFNDADLDRDRKMVASWSLGWNASRILAEAAAARPDLLLDRFVKALEAATADVEQITETTAQYMDAAAVDKVVQVFKTRHGENAVPVATTADSKDIEHFGKTGIVVSKPMKTILETRLGKLESVKAKLAKETKRVYGWHELTPEQKKVLEDSLQLLSFGVASASLSDVDVVDFHSDDLLGMYKDSRVLVAFKELGSVKTCLSVLVHEYAHRAGGDGGKMHVQTIEETWAAIVDNLWK